MGIAVGRGIEGHLSIGVGGMREMEWLVLG